MRLKTWLILLGVSGCIAAAAAYAYFNWDALRASHRFSERMERAQTIADEGQLRKALDILVYDKPEHLSSAENEAWTRETIRLAGELRDVLRIEVISRTHGDWILEDEAASMLWARNLMHQRDFNGFENIRNEWKDHEKSPELWFFIDVDRLVLEGKQEEAIELLKNTTLGNVHDATRLTRLALFDAQDLEQSWDYLTQAYAADPRNADVRLFSGQILESAGQIQPALIEYLAAYQIDTDNALMQRQLGDFFLRLGDIPGAINVWDNPDRVIDGEKIALADFIWIKAYFWSRVYNGLQRDIPPMAYSNMDPVAEMLDKLPENVYWNSALVDQFVDVRFYAQVYPELYWLQVLQALQDGDEDKAIDLLQLNPFLNAPIQANITAALPMVLQFRASNHFTGPWPVNFVPNTTEHIFFRELFERRGKKVPPQETIGDPFYEMLYGPDAFSATFLAAGWLDAAIAFHSNNPTSAYPDWYAYGMTQAFRFVQSPEKALEFALAQRENPALTTLIGELYLQLEDVDQAIATLDSVARLDADASIRAAWLLCILYLDSFQADKALEALKGQERLLNSIAGQELLAKIYIAKEDFLQAKSVYGKILDFSAEANVFHARQAFVEERWEDARNYTERLVEAFPNMRIFQDNLKKIEEAQNSSG